MDNVSFNNVRDQVYADALSIDINDDRYQYVHELALKYEQVEEKQRENIAKLKTEEKIAKQRLEMEDRHKTAEFEQRDRFHEDEEVRWKAEQGQREKHWEAEMQYKTRESNREHDRFMEEFRQREAIATKELELKGYEVANKKKANFIDALKTVGCIGVGLASIGIGAKLGTKGLETDITSYNQSPNTLRQAENMVSSSTKYLN